MHKKKNKKNATNNSTIIVMTVTNGGLKPETEQSFSLSETELDKSVISGVVVGCVTVVRLTELLNH